MVMDIDRDGDKDTDNSWSIFISLYSQSIRETFRRGSAAIAAFHKSIYTQVGGKQDIRFIGIRYTRAVYVSWCESSSRLVKVKKSLGYMLEYTIRVYRHDAMGWCVRRHRTNRCKILEKNSFLSD